MLKEIRFVPQDETTHLFATAEKKCHLKERGFAEEEYIFSGTANVYEKREGKKQIRYEGAPYTNRMIVRKPEKAENFSGNIVIEILNSTSQFDIDRVWVLTEKQFVRNGDIYIGITSKPNAVEALKRFDGQRYGELNWKNPLSYDMDPATVGNLAPQGMPSPLETEDGLFWDMLLDVARLVKSDTEENPLKEYLQKKVYLYLAGWSQSGGYIIRYIQDFAQSEGKDLFDGYFSCGSVSACTPSLNQEDPQDLSKRQVPMLDKPMIDMHTESDNVFMGNDMARKNNGPFYRVYDIVGPSHDTAYSMTDYFKDDKDLEKIGMKVEFPGKETFENNFPYEYAYNAAFAQLCSWVREGVQPIDVEPIEIDPDQMKSKKDETGNSKGGWRLPLITYPLCVYHESSTPKNAECEFGSTVYGYEEPYPLEKLKTLYLDAEHYGKLMQEEVKKCVEKGLLLPEDTEGFVERAVETARKFGL